MKTYYYVDANWQQQGPVAANNLPKQGITHDTLVWTEGMNDWQAAGTLPELSAIFAPPPIASSPFIHAKPHSIKSKKLIISDSGKGNAEIRKHWIWCTLLAPLIVLLAILVFDEEEKDDIITYLSILVGFGITTMFVVYFLALNHRIAKTKIEVFENVVVGTGLLNNQRSNLVVGELCNFEVTYDQISSVDIQNKGNVVVINALGTRYACYVNKNGAKFQSAINKQRTMIAKGS